MRVLIYGGGTVSHVRNHLGLCAFSRGTTARRLHQLIPFSEMFLTFMGSETSKLVTVDDVWKHIQEQLDDPYVKVIILSAAICDYEGTIGDVDSGSHATRLQSRSGEQTITIKPSFKIIDEIKAVRPDIKIVGFKTTTGAQFNEQQSKALRMGVDYVLANDVITRRNFIISKNASYSSGREECIQYIADRISAMRGDINTEFGKIYYEDVNKVIMAISLYKKMSLNAAKILAVDTYNYGEDVETVFAHFAQWSDKEDGALILTKLGKENE